MAARVEPQPRGRPRHPTSIGRKTLPFAMSQRALRVHVLHDPSIPAACRGAAGSATSAVGHRAFQNVCRVTNSFEAHQSGTEGDVPSSTPKQPPSIHGTSLRDCRTKHGACVHRPHQRPLLELQNAGSDQSPTRPSDPLFSPPCRPEPWPCHTQVGLSGLCPPGTPSPVRLVRNSAPSCRL